MEISLDSEFYSLPLHERLRKLVDSKWSHYGHGYRKKAAEEIGLSQEQLSKTLKGRHYPTDEMLEKIAEAVGPSADLINGLSIQVAGTVSAGDGADDLAVPKKELATGKLFPPGSVAYFVRGNSMRDSDIAPGDHVIVRREPPPSVGEIVVVFVPECGTVVKLKRERSYEGANDRDPRPPIPRTPQCKEYGVLIGVVRTVDGKKRKGK